MIPFKYKGKMILGDKAIYDMDCYKTQLNNNVLVCGAAGTGKTRSIVTPNLLNMEGNYIMSDPKGNLYDQYAGVLEEQGYDVKRISFINPKISSHYNPLAYIHSEEDIQKLAHMIIYSDNKGSSIKADPFWDRAGELLVAAVIGYLMEFASPEERNMRNVNKLVRYASPTQSSFDTGETKSALDQLFDHARTKLGEPEKSFAIRQYKQYRLAAERTLKSILITVSSITSKWDTEYIGEMTASSDLDFTHIAQNKTAIFVEVSDNDRSQDALANLFFTQAVQELCRYADTECENSELPIPMRFILDDFATNVTISDFPRKISSFRSRRISVMLMIQAESQLRASYDEDAETIISNCDTYVYMGSGDLSMARKIAERIDCQTSEVLNMPLGKQWIFRRGEKPLCTDRLQVDKLIGSIER